MIFFKKIKIFCLLFIVCFVFACSPKLANPVILSKDLKIIAIKKNVFVHQSYLTHIKYGRFSSNGLIYIQGNEAIVFDTPTTDTLSNQLIDWITKVKKSKIKAVVINHFHVDCLGGLSAFHQSSIPSYANHKTIELCKQNETVIPQNGFEQLITHSIGGKQVESHYLGEAHTKDNIVSWLKDEKVLFGGCMIKSLSSGKGNLDDANIAAWSNTVKKVRSKFSDAKIIVPGHGKYGDIQLLDYTIEMFSTDK